MRAVEGLDVAHAELDVLRAHPLGTGTGVFDRLRVALDSDHAPFGTDEPGGEKGDMAGTGSEVENPHSGAQPGGLKEALGERVEEGCLAVEALLFSLAVHEPVLGHWSPPSERAANNVGTSSRTGYGSRSAPAFRRDSVVLIVSALRLARSGEPVITGETARRNLPRRSSTDSARWVPPSSVGRNS